MTYYYPKKPVKSFLDLEVYQKLLAISVAVVNQTQSLSDPYGITKNLHECVLSLPVKIASAHSIRFSEPDRSILALEEVMLGCNKAVVYLEQFRDLYPDVGTADVAFFDEQIKALLFVRSKALRLQRSWKKFMSEAPLSPSPRLPSFSKPR